MERGLPCHREGRVVKQTFAIEQNKNEHHERSRCTRKSERQL